VEAAYEFGLFPWIPASGASISMFLADVHRLKDTTDPRRQPQSINLLIQGHQVVISKPAPGQSDTLVDFPRIDPPGGRAEEENWHLGLVEIGIEFLIEGHSQQLTPIREARRPTMELERGILLEHVVGQ
jgi:hypothetical protein